MSAQKASAVDISRESWYLSLIDRTARPRFDVLPVFADPAAFSALVEDIVAHFADKLPDIDMIFGLDALGFVLGSAVAVKARKGLGLVRKGGKLPRGVAEIVTREFADWDGAKAFEMRKDAVRPGMKVIIVDEWIGEGAQMAVVISLLESLGATVEGIAVLYCFADMPQNLELAKKFDLFCANCLKCTYFKCRCGQDSETIEG